MQLSEIRINLCGPTPPSFPHSAHSASQHVSQHASQHALPHNSSHDSHHPDLPRGGRLRAFCSLTFDNTFVVRDVKLIEGNDGLFLAMPSRKLCDRCRRCGEKNHLRARFCNQCGTRLDETRHMGRAGQGSGQGGGQGGGYSRSMIRPKLHADIAHPINAECRLELERRVLMAYLEELERSKLPGYVPPNLDGDYADSYDVEPAVADARAHLRPTGTDLH